MIMQQFVALFYCQKQKVLIQRKYTRLHTKSIKRI